MIRLGPWNDLDGRAVFDRLDPADLTECQLICGTAAGPLSVWADWRAAEPARLVSYVAYHGPTPFAVFGLSNSGQAGVAEAALLARDHARWRLPLGRLAVMIRRGLPVYLADMGIHRVEARSWADHPTAPRLLAGLGFAAECRMRGFGLTGGAIFTQYALLAVPGPDPSVVRASPATAEDRPCA